MRNIFVLTKTGLNVNFGLSALKYRFKVEKKKRWEPILIGLSILMGVGVLVAFYTFFLISAYMVGVQLGQPEIILTISILLAQIVVMFFGIFYIMSTLYFSKDTDILLPLPLKPHEVLGSKIMVIIINEYLTVLPLLLPSLIIYGIGEKQGLFYWLKSLVIILIVPIIPLNISAFFIMILMRFINFRKGKDALAIIGGLLGMFLGLGFNFFFQRMGRMSHGNEGEFVKNIITKQQGMINLIGEKFPPSIWATRGLSDGGFSAAGFLILFIIVSLLLFMLLLYLGSSIFYKSLLAGQEASGKKKILSRGELLGRYEKISTPVFSLFKREWKLVLRVPIFALNCLTGIIMGPFMLALIMLTGDMGAEGLGAIIGNPDYSFYIQLGGLALMLFISSMNIAASTALSREGSTFWISKMIPVPAKQQILAKFLNGYFISSLGVITTAILFAIFLLPVQYVIIITLLALIGSVSLTAFNLIIDMNKPKLLWDNPQEAVKQNMNGLLGMLVSFLILGILIVATVVMINIEIQWWIIYIILALAMSMLGVISVGIILKLAEKKYRVIEI